MEREWGNGGWLPSRSTGPAVPTKLPLIPGFLLDALHEAPPSGARTGQAWFDVLALSGGRAAMLVGDVAQQTVPEGAAAAHVQAAVTGLMTDSTDRQRVLERMEHRVRAAATGLSTTVCLAIVDAVESGVEFRTYGHPPPLIVSSGGSRYADVSGTGWQGDSGPVVPTSAGRLAPDEVLVLYTQGTKPQPGAAVAAEFVDLPSAAQAGADAAGDPVVPPRIEAVCRAAVEVLRPARTRGDLAVLAVQHRPVVPRLHLTVPAIAESIEAGREAVVDWLSGLKSSVEDGAGLAMAVGEAMANAVQHAFAGAQPGSVTVEASLQPDGAVTCYVRDDGRWLTQNASPSGRRGRGFGVMARLCDRMVVRRDANGTVIELRRRLHHPVLSAAGGQRA